MRIGELAARTGCTESQIRYYERRGLLPAPARAKSGYRLYGAADEARLCLLARAKLLGLSLVSAAELVATAEDGCCAQTDEAADAALRRRIDEIDGQIAELARLRATLVDALTGRAGLEEAADGCGGPFCLPAEADVRASGRRELPVAGQTPGRAASRTAR